MTSREYLENAYALSKAIKTEIEIYQRNKEAVYKITSILSDMPHGTSISDKVSDIIPSLIDMKTALSKELIRYNEMTIELCRIADEIHDPRIRIMLKLRYCDAMPWKEIADHIGYQKAQIFRYRNKMLSCFDDAYKFYEISKHDTKRDKMRLDDTHFL